MAEETKENQAQASADAEAAGPENQVKVEEAGTLKKKLTVTVPRQRIDAKRDEMFGELSQSAQIPGFRIGRAPRRLVEKRFGKEVAADVRNALIGESIGSAIEKSDLKSLGEPSIDLEKIELPDSGDLEFSFEVEIAPEFDLPELKGIKVEKPVLDITDERVDRDIADWSQSQARYEATTDAAAEGDAVTAGATIFVAGQDETHDRPGLTLRVAPGQIEGIPLVDLGKALAGRKADETAEIKVTVPNAHPNESWRGKEATIAVRISQVRKRMLPAVDDKFAAQAGFESLDELRRFVRQRLTAQLETETRQAMHQQVQQYLLSNADFKLPEGVLARHTARLIQRRYVELLQRGVPRERIDERLTELQAAADEQARRDLKLQFILDKVAETRQIEVSDDEVNARVAQMAGMYNRRPERLRQELAADGTLAQLGGVIREEKAVDALLNDAEVTEVKPASREGEPDKGKPAAKKKTPAKKPAEKKPAEKAAKRSTKKPAGKASRKKSDE